MARLARLFPSRLDRPALHFPQVFVDAAGVPGLALTWPLGLAAGGATDHSATASRAKHAPPRALSAKWSLNGPPGSAYLSDANYVYPKPRSTTVDGHRVAGRRASRRVLVKTSTPHARLPTDLSSSPDVAAREGMERVNPDEVRQHRLSQVPQGDPIAPEMLRRGAEAVESVPHLFEKRVN
jgi:hypothetical protein